MSRILKITISFILIIMIICMSMTFVFAYETDESDTSKNIDIAQVKAPEVISDDGEIIKVDKTAMYGDALDIKASAIPDFYSSKDLGYTTEIKDQYKTGCCWAYSSSSMLETFLNKNKMYEEKVSPLHMAYRQSSVDDKGWIARDGFLNSGGNATISMGYLVSPIGSRKSYLEDLNVMDINKKITEELENEYRNTAKEFDENSDREYIVDSIALLNPDDKDTIKQAIMNYGSVAASFDVSYDNFSDNYYAYYAKEKPSEEDAGGHSVLVVGWDDNFSKENFVEKPQNDGAWICQNSWGDSVGDEGYFYISYEDVTLFDPDVDYVWTITKAHKISSFENYYTLNENCGVITDHASYKNLRIMDFCNKYTFGKDEVLEKVNFESPSVGAEYTIFVIPSKNDGTPSKENWVEIGRGRILHSGYTSADVKDVDVSEKTCFIGIRLANSSPNIKMGITTDVDNYFIHTNGNSKTSFTRKTDQDFYELSDPDRDNAYWIINAQTTKAYRYGDADFDRVVTINDASFIQKLIAHYIDDETLSEGQRNGSDSNNDKVINIVDATLIQRYLADLQTNANINQYVK